MSLFDVRNISFSYPKTGKKVFSDVSFSLEKGEIMAVLGPNGAGKTTLLRCMTGLLRSDGGEVFLNGENIRKIRPKDLWSSVSYVPQNGRALSSYSVLETVLLGKTGELGLFSAPDGKDLSEAEEILSLLGIGDLKDRRVNTLSGGEQQMVLIARALISKPELLILDEPESGLDFRNQLVVLDTLSMLKKQGMACIFNTHYPEHALLRADRVLILSGGKAVCGRAEEIITKETIRDTFGVQVVIGEVRDGSNAVKSIVPIKRI